jgi:hypothetical protein
MTRFKLILSLVALSGLALVAVLQREHLAKLRAENELLRAQFDDLHAAQADASASANDSSTHERLSELLELRVEVTRLREQANQVGALKEANQNLATSLKELKGSRTDIPKKKGPEDALPQDIHPRDSWAFRGYATPEATIESMLWARVNGDNAAMVQAFSPEEQPHIQKGLEKGDFSDNDKEMTEFRILDRRQLSNDEMVVLLYMTRLGANGKNVEDTGNAVIQRIGGEWKLTGHGMPDD